MSTKTGEGGEICAPSSGELVKGTAGSSISTPERGCKWVQSGGKLTVIKITIQQEEPDSLTSELKPALSLLNNKAREA